MLLHPGKHHKPEYTILLLTTDDPSIRSSPSNTRVPAPDRQATARPATAGVRVNELLTARLGCRPLRGKPVQTPTPSIENDTRRDKSHTDGIDGLPSRASSSTEHRAVQQQAPETPKEERPARKQLPDVYKTVSPKDKEGGRLG